MMRILETAHIRTDFSKDGLGDLLAYPRDGLQASQEVILVIAYHLIRRRTSYIDLGADYFDQRKTQAIQNQLVKRLERLGLKVTLETISTAA